MNDVVTKMTKNVSSVKMPEISIPKLTVPEQPIITISKGPQLEIPDTVTPGVTPSVTFNQGKPGISISKISNKTFFGISLFNILLGIIIIVILAILGVNIFLYLAEGTDIIGDIIQNFVYILPESIAKTFRLSAIGTESAGDFAADTLDDVSNVIKGDTENGKKRKGGESREDLEKVLEEEKERMEKKKERKKKNRRVRDNKIREIALKQVNEDNLKQAVENRDMEGISKYIDFLPAGSKYKTKKGTPWCYIGMDRGFKSCVKLNESEKCMSGKFFKTKGECEYKD